MDKKYKIVLVDDEGYSLKLLAEAFPWEECGFSVAGIFQMPDEAAEWIISNEVDAVITDIKMPVMNGNEMIERIKEKKPDTVFGVTSAYDDFVYVRKSLQLGAIDYILKPIDFEDVKKMCAKLCGALNKKTAEQKETSLLSLHEQIKYIMAGLDECSEHDLSGNGLKNTKTAYIKFRIISDKDYLSSYSLDDLRYALDNLFLFAKFEWVRVFENADSFDMIALDAKETCDFETEIKKEIENIKTEAQNSVNIKLDAESCDVFENMYKLRENRAMHERYAEQAELVCEVFEKKGPKSACIIVESVYNFFEDDEEKFLCFAKQLLKKLCGGDFEKGTAKELYKRLVSVLNKSDEPADKSEREQKMKQRFEQYIEEHYAEDISLSTVADYMYMSPGYFSRYVKKMCGEKYIDYLIKVRLEKAQKLLLSGNYKVSDVCEKVGFRSVQNFYRMFAKAFGVSPQKYREKVMFGEIKSDAEESKK